MPIRYGRTGSERMMYALFCVSSVWVQAELFSEYDVSLVRGEDTAVRFKVALSALLECLAIFGHKSFDMTSLHLAYVEETAKLHLLLESQGMTTECVLTTADFSHGDDTDHDAAFKAFPVAAKAVIKSEVLHDALREVVEVPGSTSISLTMSPESPFFRLHAYGNLGASTVDIAANSDAFVSWECSTTVV